MAKPSSNGAGAKGTGVLSAALGESAGGGVGRAAVDDLWFNEYPLLHTFITAVTGDDGKPRSTSTIMMFSEDGRFKVVLHERQHGLSLWREGDTIKGCLDGLESSLASGRAEWRKDRQSRR